MSRQDLDVFLFYSIQKSGQDHIEELKMMRRFLEDEKVIFKTT